MLSLIHVGVQQILREVAALRGELRAVHDTVRRLAQAAAVKPKAPAPPAVP